MQDMVERFIDGRHLEGDGGCGVLEELLRVLGYNETGFRFGSPIESFLSDNPGAQEALVNWVAEQNLPEWQSALGDVVEDEDEDEDEDEEDYDE